MSRRLQAVRLVVVLLAVVAGCSLGTDTQTTPAAPAAQAPTNAPSRAPQATLYTLPIGATTAADSTGEGAASASASPDLPVREVAARVRPAIVQIATEQVVHGRSRFGPASVLEGIGTGIIVDDAGHILTNHHVIAGAQTIAVSLTDDRVFDARLVGGDPDTDLAVVQIQGDQLPVAALGQSSQLAVGDEVVAIGHALGLPGGPTVTAGVVSALGRTVQEPDEQGGETGPRLYDVIQTDAAINPGNSGGPLVNRQAEVIGINTLVAGSDESGTPTQGVGFAIAIDTAKPIADQLIATGRVQHAYLGIVYEWAGGASARQTSKTATPGDKIDRVQSGSPATRAGLQQGDIIMQINGQPIKDETTLPKTLAQLHPGDTVQLSVARGSAQQTVTVVLTERPTS